MTLSSHKSNVVENSYNVAENNIILLSGDDWAKWFVTEVNQASSSIHLSIYMISDHWRSPELGNLNLVKTLAEAGQRGLTCRCIIDQPHVINRRIKFNTQAARKLQQSGWKIRVMPSNVTLHEKVLILDKRLSVVGSHNISKASALSNFDTSLAIHSESLAMRMHRHFWERWRMAVPFVADAWQK
jgi:phosphatidylserine/phosphatidylglycerophosphate/cardiolipin synthase-like enzyme